MTLNKDIPHITVGIFTRQEIRFALEGNFHSTGVGVTLTGECVAHRATDSIVVENNGKSFRLPSGTTLTPVNGRGAFTLNDVTIGVQFHWQRNEDQRFVGSLKLVDSKDGITAVNVVSIEDYLTSVISSEMSAESSLNLLKAHAITSRSWLLAQLEKSRTLKDSGVAYSTSIETETERIRWYDREDHAHFDVCGDDHCQRYQGITKAYSPAVAEATAATRGMVIKHAGKVCDARFSKCCGGVTEAFEHVWEPRHFPYLVAVSDFTTAHIEVADLAEEQHAQQWIRSTPAAFCNTSDKRILSQVLLNYDQETSDFFRWKVEYAQDELAAIIQKRSGLNFGRIIDLVPVERGASGRLVKLKIVGSKRTFTIGKELEIRRTLSNSHLYSSAFTVQKIGEAHGVPSRFVLHGAGWGHGVGLCQIGAAVMGEQGFSHEEIVAHYFPQTGIEKIY